MNTIRDYLNISKFENYLNDGLSDKEKVKVTIRHEGIEVTYKGEVDENLTYIARIFEATILPSANDPKKTIKEKLDQRLDEIMQSSSDVINVRAVDVDNLPLRHKKIIREYKLCDKLSKNIDSVFNDVCNIEKYNAIRDAKLKELIPKLEEINRLAGNENFDMEDQQVQNSLLDAMADIDTVYESLDSLKSARKFSIPNILSKFLKVQTIGIIDINHIGKWRRRRTLEKTIQTLEKSMEKEINGLEQEGILPKEQLLSKLQFSLAVGKLAQNPSKKDFIEVMELLKETKGLGKLYEAAKGFTYEEFKNKTGGDSKNANDDFKEFWNLCTEAGVDKLINKRDVKDVFVHKTTRSTKEKIFKMLTTVTFIAALPVVWTVAAATAVIAAMVYVVGGAIALAAMLVALPIWVPIASMFSAG